jgi:hypothetical protein
MRQQSGAGVTAIGAAAAAYVLLARSRQLRWGASDDEAGGPLPGDELIPHPDLSPTRAIAVRSSAGRVWPWIAQLGQGRGGFYSYDFLENLAGCDIHSADRIIPEWQGIRVGDEVKLAPQVALEVAALEPRRALVLRGGVPMGTTPPPYNFSWAFVLREHTGGARETPADLQRARGQHHGAASTCRRHPCRGSAACSRFVPTKARKVEAAVTPRELPARATTSKRARPQPATPSSVGGGEHPSYSRVVDGLEGRDL